MINTQTSAPPNKSHTLHRFFGLYLLLIPCMLYILLFAYTPMLGVIIAFKKFNMAQGIFGSPWCGLDNFLILFHGKEFLAALRNTIVISLLRLIFGFSAPIVLALLLNEVRHSWYKRTIQTVTYLPYFFSWVVLGGIFLMFFSQSGSVNNVLGYAGIKPLPFLMNSHWFIVMLIATSMWQSAGYGAVIYLAALSGISPSLYEAAMVDGAGRWQQALHITLPLLMPTIVTLLILSMGGILDGGFDQIFNMHNPLVYDSSDIIDTFVFRKLTSLDYSLSVSAGLFKSVVGLMMIIIVNFIAKRTTNNEQGVW